MGIYNGLYSVTPDILPPQSISLKEKLAEVNEDDGEKTWRQQCMDSLEAIGKSQFNSNLKLIENYEMIKGRFIYNHYFHSEGYESMIEQLTAEFELPNYLRHYDIISQVTNTLSGEWQKRPDLFKVRQLGEGAANEYLRTKQEMTMAYVADKINSEINKKLAAQGIDINKQDFESEEEAQQYGEQVNQMRQEMTPEQIQKFMDTDFLTLAEIWGQHQKEYDKELFNLSEKERVEFEDMLVADRCFRHFYITPTGYGQETWNPINVFFHKSPDLIAIEDGDYVGRIFNLSINTIIDRYGYLMSKEDFEMINGIYKKDSTKWNDHQYNWVYNNYMMPFQGYPAVDIMKQSWGKSMNGSDIPEIDPNYLTQLNENNFFTEREGYYFVTEAYWKTQKKIIKITYIDDETGQLVVQLVDENYIIPKEFVESDALFTDDHDVNTYCSTYINEVWKGIKINTGVDKELKKDLYLAVGPNDFQFKGDLNIYGCKLPVCGQVFSVRNSRSMSLVDMMKPYQIGYNVAINQLYQLAEKEIGMFAIMDVNMFPNSKDWGGEDSWGKWMLIAKNLGMVPADTSPANIQSSLAATGGFLPKIMDLNVAGQMVSRMNIAKFFEEQALKQVGFNQYRTGAYSADSTAAGVEQGRSASYNQTESYFTNFSNYLRRAHQMSLGIAQYVQSQKEEVTFTYIKSDMSRAFIKMFGMDLLLADIGVFVSNSQENARQLEMIRKFALENNTAGLSPVDVADVITMNSPQEIRRQLKTSFDAMQKQAAEANEIKKQEIEAFKEAEQNKLQEKARQFDELMENNLDRVRLAQGAAIINTDNDLPEQIDTSREDSMKAAQASSTSDIQRQRLELDKVKTSNKLQTDMSQIELKRSKIAADIAIQNKETETARIMKDKENAIKGRN